MSPSASRPSAPTSPSTPPTPPRTNSARSRKRPSNTASSSKPSSSPRRSNRPGTPPRRSLVLPETAHNNSLRDKKSPSPNRWERGCRRSGGVRATHSALSTQHSLDSLEYHHRDLTILHLLAIPVEERHHRRLLIEQPRPLRLLRRIGPRPKGLTFVLDRYFRVGDEVEVPVRVRRRAPLRPDHHQPVAVHAEVQRRHARLPALRPGRRQQNHRPLPPRHCAAILPERLD